MTSSPNSGSLSRFIQVLAVGKRSTDPACWIQKGGSSSYIRKQSSTNSTVTISLSQCLHCDPVVNTKLVLKFKNNKNSMVQKSTLFSSASIPWSLIDTYQCFGRSCHFYLQGSRVLWAYEKQRLHSLGDTAWCSWQKHTDISKVLAALIIKVEDGGT